MIRFLCLTLFTLLFSIQIVCAQATSTTQNENHETGTVLETMDASGYTYMNLETAGQKIWVAVPASKVSKGEKVTFQEGMVMENFHSKTLDRTFETIIFSPGLTTANFHGGGSGTVQAASSNSSFSEAVKQESQEKQQPKPSPQAGSGGSAGATVPYLETQVEKAQGDNGYTVEEIFKQAEKLNGSTIRVRGMVVKFSPNIMGRNWIHVQDGTGDPMSNTHDLVITTADSVDVDQVILVEGTLSANKDFGYGYKYDALVEQASVSQ